MKIVVGRQPSPRCGGTIIIEELSEQEFGSLVRGLRAEQAMAFVHGVATNECLFLHEQLSEILRSRAFRSGVAGRDIGGEMRYRKRPVVIDAVQLTWPTWHEMCAFAGVGKLSDGKPQGCLLDEGGDAKPEEAREGTMGLLIPTLEGLMIASESDWVIRGVNGELYSCKADIFELTYEAADTEPIVQGD